MRGVEVGESDLDTWTEASRGRKGNPVRELDEAMDEVFRMKDI